LGGRRSERDKGKNKEYRVRALPSARDDYVFDRANKSHPRNQTKPWDHSDSKAFFVLFSIRM